MESSHIIDKLRIREIISSKEITMSTSLELVKYVKLGKTLLLNIGLH